MLFTTQPLGVWVLVLFARRDGARGAHISAGAAVNAGIRIDDVLAVALRDAGNGTLARARAAGNAIVVNLKGHQRLPPKRI